MKQDMVTKACTVQFRGYGSITLPAGLRAKFAYSAAHADWYWLDEFPPDLFPRNSLILHDAVHYGVLLTGVHQLQERAT